MLHQFPSTRRSLSLLLALFLTITQSCGGRPRSNGLTIILEKRIETFDPRVSSDSAAERIRQLIFNGLTRKDEKFNPVPDLAERFESTPDHKSFSFYLRPNIKFHNKRLLSAADVKYTFETMLARGFPSQKKAELARDLASIEISPTNPLGVIFHCINPCPNLPNTIIPIGIIPEGMADQQAKLPVGTGPFMFDSYTEDQEVVLSANKEYFEGAPGINRLAIKIVPDNNTRESEIRKGSADLAINADFDPITVIGLQNASGIKVEQIEGTNIAHLGINLVDPILKDVRIRQALAYAIDRVAMIRDVWLGQARPARSILPPTQWAYEPNVTTYPYDPERAKQLLDSAGKPEQNGKRFKLTLKTSTISISRKTSEAIQEQLRRIGIELDLLPLERQKLIQDLSDNNFQLYLNILVGGNQSPDIFKFVYGSKSIPPNGQNRSRYSNPQIDKLLDEAQTAKPERAKAIYSQVQKTLADDLPQIYLWHPATIVVRRDRVDNVRLDPSGDWRVIRSIKLDER